ncbi:serine hydrolase [Flavitalea flava]
MNIFKYRSYSFSLLLAAGPQLTMTIAMTLALTLILDLPVAGQSAVKSTRQSTGKSAIGRTGHVSEIPAGLPPGLDNYIEKALQTFEVPGLSISIVQNGKVLLTRGYGLKKLGDTAHVDAHTLFLIASNTKAFTATALSLLVEEGKLKWEDPVIDHLPWFRMSDPYITMHMTIRDLLVHHSGIPAYAGDLMIFPPSAYSRKEIVGKLSRIPLTRGFRTTYAYDNILYLAAGEVIIAVSGMEWEEFIRTRIFDKLGMSESISRFSTLKDQSNVAMAHTRLDGKVKTVDRFMNLDIGDAGNPAGGICTNANDMARWLITQLDSGMAPNKTRLFQPSATRELWKVVTPMPIENMPEELKPAQMNFRGYALGFRSFNYGSTQIVCHGGMLSGFVSQIALVPKLNLGISIFTNQESSGAYWAIIYQILDYYLQNGQFDWIGGYKKQLDSALVKEKKERDERDNLEKNREKRELAARSAVTALGKASLPMANYAGAYTDTLYGPVDITLENDRLVLRFRNLPELAADLDHYQFDTFIARFRNRDLKADAYVSFALDPQGTFDQVKLKGIDPASDMDFDGVLLRPVKHGKTE